MDPEKVLAQLTEQFENVSADVKGLIQAQEVELKKYGETQKTTVQGFSDIEKKVEDAQGTLSHLTGRIDELEKIWNRPPDAAPGSQAEELKDIGGLLTESKQYEAMREEGSAHCSPIQLKSFRPYIEAMIGPIPSGMPFEQKVLSTAAASVGDAIGTFRIPGFIAQPLTPSRLRNLIPTIPTTRGSIEYIKETDFHQLYTLIDGTSSSGAKTLHVTNTAGFYVGQTVTVAPGVGGAEETHVLTAVTPSTTLGDFTGTLTTTENLTYTHAAEVEVVSDTYVCTAETTLKPQADINLDLLSEAMKTLAHHIPASRQSLEDTPGLRGHVNMRLLASLVLSQERMLLYGAGGTKELSGIMQDSDIQTYAWSDGLSGDLELDAVRRAMTVAALAHYPVTGAVLHPRKWERIQTAKGDDGHYIWAMVPSGTGNVIWRVPVVECTVINEDDGLVGAFNIGATIWDREKANIRVSENVGTQFIENMATVLAEERLCQTVERPESFVSIDFDSAPA